ncbi:MAG: prepilin peptidase [Patescibacteria group bacterium]|nr:prepilin peptidase [Patescibacteria group bacterium]
MWPIDPTVFILGLLIGSFLNVVIYRYNTGLGIQSGRSRCFSCSKILYWYELIPVLSFVLQRGRCRACRSLLSWQYPLVELVSGLMFLAIWNLLLPLPLTALYWAIFSLLLVILVYDLRHKIIPDGLVFAFIILSLVAALLQSAFVGGLLTGAALFVGFWALWHFSGGRWMGFGDAKLVAGVGLLLGLRGGLSAIILAFWIGAVAGLLLILFTRLFPRNLSLTMKSELPFAPFIILGVALNVFLGINVLAF